MGVSQIMDNIWSILDKNNRGYSKHELLNTWIIMIEFNSTKLQAESKKV